MISDQKKRQNLTPNQALQKLKQYCAYQERCHSEVNEKSYEYGLNKDDIAYCISQLIEEDYLNEERFAIAYVGGKFRTKHWGKQKIQYQLRQKQISKYCIDKALALIDLDEYYAVAEQEFEKKLNTLKSERNHFTKKRKLTDYMQQHGFEFSLISELLKKIK